MIFIAISYHGSGGSRGARAKPQKMFRITPFPSKGNVLFDIERALQKWYFCSFAEKGRDPDPQDLPSCAPALAQDGGTLLCLFGPATLFMHELGNVCIGLKVILYNL